MSISNAMLANGIIEYLKKNAEEFENFLCESYDVDLRIDYEGESIDNDRILIRLETLAQDESPINERSYSLRIESP